MANPLESMMALEAPEAEEVAESTTVSFAPPPGFKQPDDVRDGETFDVVAKCKMEGGQVVIESINGIALGDNPEEEEMEVEEEVMPEEEIAAVESTAPTLREAAKATGY